MTIWKNKINLKEIGRFPPLSGTYRVNIDVDFQRQSIWNLVYGGCLIQDGKGNIEIETSPLLKLGSFFMGW